MRRSLLLLPLLFIWACSDDSPVSSDAETNAIRQVITNWELAIEESDNDLMRAQFLGSYWPASLSFRAIANMGGAAIRILATDIQVGANGAFAEAEFVFREDGDPISDRRVIWRLESRPGWLVIDEDWTVP